MTLSRTSLAFTLLTVLACSQFTLGQDQTSPAATSYKYSAVNFSGASATLGTAIDNQGETVGYYTGASCSQTDCGFSDVKGTFTPIECALENETRVYDISNKGEIIGTYTYFGGVHGFILQGNASCFDIVDPLGSSYTDARGVNDSGEIVGFYIDSANNAQGFLYNGSKETYTTISCAGFTNTLAYGINDAGEIVGAVGSSDTGPFSAFVYKSGKCTTFSFPKATSTTAIGVNKSGQISGDYTDSSGVNHGFLRTGSSFQSINYPASNGTLGYHLNDKGQIAGIYSDKTNAVHGFVATPK
ncbi:MAG: hypothetical protein ABSD75_20945 [Terriglobales bacterium]|jgi:hypothetical protein